MKNNKNESIPQAGAAPVPTTVSPETVLAAIAALRQTQALMTNLSRLSRAERRQLRKIGPGKVRLVESHVQAAQQHRSDLPPSFGMEQFETDAALTTALAQYIALLEDMRSQARDTLSTVGTRAV